MALVHLSVVPLGTSSTSLSHYVAKAEKVLRDSGLRHELGAMGTVIEGDLDDILRVVRAMHEVPFGEGALRVMTILTIDDRRDKVGTIQGKLRSVEEKLGQ